MTNPGLPRRSAFLYASGSFSTNLVSRVVSAWLFFFYAASSEDADVPRRLPVWQVGVILTATNLVESLCDPLIGYWSDRTRSRWGRRIPFIVLATPPWALLLFLLWTPPHGGESAANAVYLAVVLLGFRLLSTLSGAPLESLLPEIASRNVDRVRVVVGQVLFGTLGVAAALMASGPLIDRFGFPVMGAVVAVAALASRLVAVGGVWRHARRDVEPVESGLLATLRATLRNDQFLYFLPTFVMFNLGITLMTAALPFFVREVIQPPDGQVGTTTTHLAAGPLLVIFATLPLVQRLALRRGKAWVYSRGMLFGAVYMPLLFMMGFLPGVPRLAQATLFLMPVGLALTSVLVFPNALMADIIDYDALRTGARREGVYYGAQNVVESIVVAFHAAILALLLRLGGTAEDPLGIRLVGPVAGASMAAGYLIFRRYTLPDAVSAATIMRREGSDRSA